MILFLLKSLSKVVSLLKRLQLIYLYRVVSQILNQDLKLHKFDQEEECLRRKEWHVVDQLDEQEKCPCCHVLNSKKKIKIKKDKKIEFCNKRKLFKKLLLKNIKLRPKKFIILLFKHLWK